MEKETNLTLIYYCRKAPSIRRIKKYQALFAQVIVVAPDDVTALPPPCKSSVLHEKKTGKVVAFNKAISQAKGTHILWLENAEKLPKIPDLKDDIFYVAQLIKKQNEHTIINHQVRLFPNPDNKQLPIPGFTIPDIYAWAKQMNWKQSDDYLSIQSNGFISAEEIQAEADCTSDSPLHLFWKGLCASQNKKFTDAIDYFTRILNIDNSLLAPWNRLAAVNGLANAQMELHRLEEAYKQTEQSLQMSARQRAPYLIRYQYFAFKNEQKKAYKALSRYHQNSSIESEANWDVILPEQQSTFLMAEIAFRLGWHQEAYTHYEQFFDCKDGSVSRAVIEKLLIYAIELHHREKAIQYFNTLFGENLSDNFDQEQFSQIREVLTLFSDNGWYDFSSSVYRQLVNDRPEDEYIKRSYIRTLIKNKELKKAQALL